MDQVEVEITGMAITARYGTLGTGDILRTDAAFAAHLVDECLVARYATAAKPVEADAGAPVDPPAEVDAPAEPRKRSTKARDDSAPEQAE